ncbi:hypothetical protein SmJEL517_g03555 [Synchytrium microbalum]|uniref:Mmc1 C-terminal domain-containing protein n=1 Tax=Synchytrium microbalum TaxID=1806994 RepID=A0A507C6C4_9FUNG|nr:uncharacterized protein SmJEL517_g03555 [Synchytrium microbalum]TPX33614.1 hypothetical protein SmJEL517_g03555 [Synchytrium microbalum]
MVPRIVLTRHGLASSRSLLLHYSKTATILHCGIRHLATSSATTPAWNVNELAPKVTLAMDETIRLQNSLGENDAKWLKRTTATANATGVLRIAVVGETLSGRTSVVDALVGNPGASLVPEDADKTYTLSYGTEVDQKTTDSDVAMSCPSDWLKSSNASIIVPPALDTLDSNPNYSLQDPILASDIIILVTDSRRVLSSPRERGVLRSFTSAGKPTAVVVDGLTTDGSTTYIMKGVDIGMHGSVPGILPPSIKPYTKPTSTKSITDLQQLITSPSTKPKSTLSTALLALSRLKARELDAQKLLSAVSHKITSLAGALKREEARVHERFVDSDLGIIERISARLVMAVRYALDDVPFWKLFWKVDGLSYDVRKQVDENTLVETEYRMTHTLGRLSETRDVLITLSSSSLSSISTTLSESTHPILHTLSHDLSRIRDTNLTALKNILPNPFSLRNEIATFHAAKGLDGFQTRVGTLVGRQFVGQSLLGAVLLGSVYLGVPWAVALPGGGLLSALGLTWMALRWSSMSDRFVGEISAEQKTLRERLLASYDTEFESTVVNPLSEVVTLAQQAVTKQKEEVSSRISRIEKVEVMVKELLVTIQQ